MNSGDYRVVSVGKTMMSITISHMSIVSISISIGVSGPLAIVITMSIWVGMVGVSMNSRDNGVVSVGKTMMSITISQVSIVGISIRIGSPLAIVVSMSISMSILSMSITMIGKTMVTITVS